MVHLCENARGDARRGYACALVLVLVCLLAWPTPAVAEAPPDLDEEAVALEEELLGDLDRISPEPDAHAEKELLLFEEMPVVVESAYTASRQAVKARWLSAPVSVLTAQDIHYSGLTMIPEMLRFVPGVDVERISRNEYALGVRGLHDSLVDRRLVLIDGKAADDPLSGGGMMLRWPLLTEDIERIEVLRGPGGGVWGANAFNGAINIITKDPKDQLGTMVSTRATQFGDSYSYLRHGVQDGDWRYRFSAGFENLEDSDDANAGDVYAMMPFAYLQNRSTTDDESAWRFDGKAIWEPSPGQTLTVGAGHSHVRVGDTEIAGTYLGDDGWIETTRLHARLAGTGDDGGSWYLQWFGNHYHSDWPSVGVSRTLQNDLEFQGAFVPAEEHRTTVGGNLRWDHLDFKHIDGTGIAFPGDPFNEFSIGTYVVHRWEPTERLALEGQVRTDWFSETTLDWSGRASLLYALDDPGKHIARFSAAKSFRVPPTYSREVTKTVPMVAYVVKPQDSLDNEETWGVECGYRGQWTDELAFDANAYYQRFNGLIGIQMMSGSMPIMLAYVNQVDADSWGVEPEVSYTADDYKVSAWYAYNDFRIREASGTFGGFRPAKHKAGLTGRLFLPDGWTFNTQYQFDGSIHVDEGMFPAWTIEPQHRLDLTISKKLLDGHGELMIGVSDVLVSERDPVVGESHFVGHDTPGRTFFLRLDLRF